ncbi:hypothetical protein, variant 1 [Capsaspora owczarzaki ATCC 30864]|uniref:RING-type domain-containing protein n=1 Tax=Capsaspora owczarzaki (strain ATCC 30864) TaxID=595528 RepID=A0A0D2WTB3_CAPO3|nr:hypothetical protein, variant 1 [Capsaspora owczarzaki ATCC 30864]
MFECSICLCALESEASVAVVCGHVFHRSCIVEWFGTSNSCPTCRIAVRSQKALVRLFFAGNRGEPTSESDGARAAEAGYQALMRDLGDEEEAPPSAKIQQELQQLRARRDHDARVLAESQVSIERQRILLEAAANQARGLLARVNDAESIRATLSLRLANMQSLERENALLQSRAQQSEKQLEQLKREHLAISACVSFRDADPEKVQAKLNNFRSHPNAVEELIKMQDWMSKEFRKQKDLLSDTHAKLQEKTSLYEQLEIEANKHRRDANEAQLAAARLTDDCQALENELAELRGRLKSASRMVVSSPPVLATRESNSNFIDLDADPVVVSLPHPTTTPKIARHAFTPADRVDSKRPRLASSSASSNETFDASFFNQPRRALGAASFLPSFGNVRTSVFLLNKGGLQ